MEPKDKIENVLIEYGYLESLLKHYSQPYDKKNMSLEEYLRKLHIIIYGIQGTSNKSDVQRTETFFKVLIKTSLRLDKDSVLFKTLSYFIQNGFDLFIKVLKDTKVTTSKEFNKLLLNVLDSEKIEKNFQLNQGEIEKALNISSFKNAFSKVKFINKIMCFILFFFRELFKKKDQITLNEIKNYLNEEKINKFYTIYDKEIEKSNVPENKNNIEEIKDVNQDGENKKSANSLSGNSPKEKEETNLSENSNISQNLVKELSLSNENGNNRLNHNEDNIAQLRKEIEDLKAKINELLPLKTKVAELEDNIKKIDNKLSLSLVINYLNGQRDSYKATAHPSGQQKKESQLEEGQ